MALKRTLCIFGFIFCFLSNPLLAKGSDVQVTELLKTTQSWDGKSLPAYPKGQPEISIVKVTIPPGVALPMHQHPVINAGILLKGEVTVTTEDKKTVKLNPGQALAEVVGTWHYGKNEGKVPAEIIIFYAGTSKTPISVLKEEGKE